MVYRFVRNAFLAAFFVPKLLFLLKESAKQRGPIVHGLGDVYFLEVHPQISHLQCAGKEWSDI